MVDFMTTVKCPICKDRISGASSADLNENLREHLAAVHQMRELTMGTREAVPGAAPMGRNEPMERPGARVYREEAVERKEPLERSREGMGTGGRQGYEGARDYPHVERLPDTGFSAPQPRVVREVETWTSRDPRRFERENYIPREEVRQWQYPVTGPYGERGPTSSEQVRERAGEERGYRQRSERGGEDMMAVECPLCGTVIRGRDEDDLSDELRGHMSMAHDIRPMVAARFRS